MGTIAARDCLRVLTLTEQVAAALIMATCQGIALRQQQQATPLTDELSSFISQCSLHSAFLDEDRPLETELRHFCELIRNEHWELYPHV